jgi:DNA-binding XRE family transcriptional regulator
MYSREELLQWLRDLGEEGRPPTKAELQDEPDAPHGETYRNRFESWEQALQEAGFSAEAIERSTQGHKQKAYTDEKLLGELRELADKIGRPPQCDEVEERADISTHTLRRHFGSFNNALRAAGLSVTNPRYSREELLEYIRELTAKQLKPPTTDEMHDAEGVPNPNTYQRRFGSWKRAKRLAIRGDRDPDPARDDDRNDSVTAEPRDPATVPLRSDLVAAREERGLSQADLADAVGVSRATVSHWETSDVTPTHENAGRLHKALQRLN